MKNWDTLEADVTRILTKHFTPGRASAIKFVSVHHNAGNLSMDDIWNTWQEREASAQYQVNGDQVGQFVWDSDTAWALGNFVANGQSINVEHANSGGAAQGWPVSGATLETGAHLVAAICKFYKLGRPQWFVNVFPHQYFSQTACPGVLAGSQAAFYIGRAQAWYDQMTGVAAPKPTPAPAAPASTGFVVQVGVDVLNIRTAPDANSPANGAITDRGRYTIVATSGPWGKLKSGAGWIHLDYTDRVNAVAHKTVDDIAREVIRGEWGNGDSRVARIQAAGYNYADVQAVVNRLL